MDKKTIDGVTYYLVKWVDQSDKTWEPIEHLVEAMGFVVKFEKELKARREKRKTLKTQKINITKPQTKNGNSHHLTNLDQKHPQNHQNVP